MQTCGLLCVENRVVGGLAGGVAHFGEDAADGELALASGLHGGTEVGVDLTVPVDDGDVGYISAISGMMGPLGP